MKKRMIALGMTLAMALSLSVPAGAAESAEQQISRAVKEAERYAYLDIETATPDMRKKILDARKTIIYNSSWAADGIAAYVEDTETGEVIEKLPAFSELFPDWELPSNDATVEDTAGIHPVKSIASLGRFHLADLCSLLFYETFSMCGMLVTDA